jgi:SAM-dependent methyltransferase
MANTDTRNRNFTRRSRSIPRKLLRQGALHLIPLYYLVNLSDLGREGIEHSGSFRFADHIYRGTPSGRTALGRWIDARLLAMPAAQAFRRRSEHAQGVVRLALESLPARTHPLRVLGVPCGIPRDMINLSRGLRSENPALLSRIEYHGVDIDHRALAVASRLTAPCGLASAHYHLGDALNPDDYPRLKFHVVISTGLGEFLRDDELAAFYARVYDVLEPGATFYTSATARDWRSEVFLQMAELVTIYRDHGELERILRGLPWRRLVLSRDPSGLQTFVTAVK